MLDHCGDQPDVTYRIVQLFIALWLSDLACFTYASLSALQTLHCMNNDAEVLHGHAYCLIYSGTTDVFNAMPYSNMETLTASRQYGTQHKDRTKVDMKRDCFLLCKRFIHITLQDTRNNRERGRIANALATMLEAGVDGVETNPSVIITMYRRAIEEGNTQAMHNLARLLVQGFHGIEAEPQEIVNLYYRSIDDGRDVQAMTNLASFLERGASGVEADPRDAVVL